MSEENLNETAANQTQAAQTPAAENQPVANPTAQNNAPAAETKPVEAKPAEKPASEKKAKRTVTIDVKQIVKAIITLIVIAALIGGTYFAIQKISSNKNGAPGGMPGGRGGRGGNKGGTVTSVRTKIAEITPLQDYVTTNGEIETQTAFDVFPTANGQVVQINFSLGSIVKKGDVLALVDPSTPGSYYQNSPVYSPISGSILTTPVSVGQKVTTASAITKIGDINNLQIRAKIPERFVGDLKIGQMADIILEAYPNEILKAKVVKISPVVDSVTRTKEIILHFTKKSALINAGMFAKVKLYTTVYDGHVAFHQDSLVNNADVYYLFTVNDDEATVSKREVTLGKNVDGVYQILSGIEPGERVVTEGMLTLYEGAGIIDIDNPVERNEEEKPRAAGKGKKPEEGKKPGDDAKKSDWKSKSGKKDKPEGKPEREGSGKKN